MPNFCDYGVRRSNNPVETSAFVDLALREHCCYLYHDTPERLAVVSCLLRTGLSSGQKCLYVGYVSGVEAASRALTKAGIDIRHAQSCGALDFKSPRDVFLPRGVFDADKTLEMWRYAADRAKREGFTGIRLLIEVTGRFRRSCRRAEWVRYEQGLTRCLADMDAAVLCIHRGKSLAPGAVLASLQLHPLALARGVFGRSMCYRPARAAAHDTPEAVSRRNVGAFVLQAGEKVWPAERGGASRALEMAALVTVIAHELRQPLAAVAANASAGLRWLNSQKPALDRVRRSLSYIAKDTARATEIIVQVRSLTRRRAGSVRRSVDVGAVIREAVESAREKMRRSRVELFLDVAGGLPAVTGNSLQLQEVVLNLTTNALQAMAGVRSRPRELHILAARDRCGAVEVTVRDTGVGFTSEGMMRAFEPFFTTKANGMGVGLWICRMIIESHGGRLWIARNMGPGSAVHFTLPGRFGTRR